MEYKKNLSFILVKPSGPDCNMDCKYCFYTRKRDYFGNDIIHRMDKETLELLIKKSLNRPHKQISFGWQGGEPTLMGLDFYKDVVELQKKYGSKMVVSNSLQTNGILLDEKWIDFLKEYSFLVGLSIDGPKEIHDSYRLDQGDKPTHHKVEQVAKMLLNSGVEVNALSVVTQKSSKDAKLLYNYLKDLGFKFMQFIPIMEMDPNNPKEVADFSVTASSYGQFLCDLFDVWVDDFVNGKPAISIRLFETFAAIYLGHEALECTFQKECGKYITVEHNGTIYSCDFFVEDTWLLGSLDNEKSLEEILNSRKQTLFGEVKRKLDKRCLKCKWLKFCYGGCPKDRLRNPATKRFNPFCESIKMFFEHADEQFKEIIAKLISCNT